MDAWLRMDPGDENWGGPQLARIVRTQRRKAWAADEHRWTQISVTPAGAIPQERPVGTITEEKEGTDSSSAHARRGEDFGRSADGLEGKTNSYTPPPQNSENRAGEDHSSASTGRRWAFVLAAFLMTVGIRPWRGLTQAVGTIIAIVFWAIVFGIIDSPF